MYDIVDVREALPVICKVRKGYAMKRVMMILILFGMAIAAPGCHKETEQDKVRKVITDIQKAAEEKEVKKIINCLSKTYGDPRGFNYDTIKGLLLGYFYQHPKISAYITNLEISIENTSAKAMFHAVLTSGSKTGSAADLIPESLGMYAFEVSLKKEADGWKVTSAKWERVGNDQGREGR